MTQETAWFHHNSRFEQLTASCAKMQCLQLTLLLCLQNPKTVLVISQLLFTNPLNKRVSVDEQENVQHFCLIFVQILPRAYVTIVETAWSSQLW